MVFRDWLLSLSTVFMIHLCCIHRSVLHFCLLLNNIPSYGYTAVIHSSVDGHLDCYHFLVIMTNAAMTIHVQVYFIVFFYTCPSFLVD